MGYLHDSGPNAQGVGVTEEQLHVGSGLRTQSVTVAIPQSVQAVCSSVSTPVGTLTGAASGSWGPSLRTALNSWSPVLPFPVTPLFTFFCVLGIGTMPRTVRVKIRATGLDQFGNRIVEVTPWIEKVQSTASQLFSVCLSKVFSVIDDAWVQTENVKYDGVTFLSQVGIGFAPIIDPTGAQTAVIADTPVFNVLWNFEDAGATSTNWDLVGTAPNFGIGTPMRVSPYGPDIPHATPEILGAYGELVVNINGPTLLNESAILPVRGQLKGGALPATGVAVGRSAAGWQGTPHKIGFYSNDNWTTKIPSITLTGSSTRASDRPATFAQFCEDIVRLNFTVRSTLGTMRGDNATSTYPRG